MARLKMLRITNTAPSADDLAAINGASASFTCLARSIGPLVTGPLFDWSSERGLVGMPFWAMALIAALAASEALFLREHI